MPLQSDLAGDPIHDVLTGVDGVALAALDIEEEAGQAPKPPSANRSGATAR